MKITELLSPENIRQGVKQACFESLFEREKLGNSGLGNGIAMPKAKMPLEVCDKAIAMFMQLDNPINYDSLDGKPVDLIFAILIPENQCETYIPILASLIEKFTDKNMLKQLRSAKSADEIWQVFEISDRAESSPEETQE